MRGRVADERGAATVELVLVVPILMIMLGLMMAGGRIWFAKGRLTDAAEAGARAASLARTSTAAVSDGRSAVHQAMQTSGLRCAGSSVVVDVSGFGVPAGTPATVRSTVGCRVPLADIMLPGLPGSLWISRSGASALDTYRGRS